MDDRQWKEQSMDISRKQKAPSRESEIVPDPVQSPYQVILKFFSYDKFEPKCSYLYFQTNWRLV